MIRIEDNVIALETEHTGYYMYQRGALMENLHYGRKIHVDAEAMREKMDTGYGTDVVYDKEENPLSLLHLCLELSPQGKGDFRQGALELSNGNGSMVNDFRFLSAEKQEGSMPPKGMPGAYGGEETLLLHFENTYGVQATLYYTVYPDCDVITRRMEICNQSKEQIVIHRCMSYQLDLPRTGYELTTFTGAWARERHETKVSLETGTHAFGSRTGVSSHYCNPFFMVTEKSATQQSGNVYGFNLSYSGSHCGQVECGPYSKTRIQAGIQADGFAWTLQPEESFSTPEAVLTFSHEGKNGMSIHMHRFVQEHIVRGVWKKKERPVLLNNWEATYFDFKESKLLKLAKEARKLGIELFVLDDGWFGERNDDTRGLGDYMVNTKKLPDGLSGLAKKIHAMGLDFGLWMEPEMVNPDSELYRAHPDWAVLSPGIAPSLGRNQLVLDLCRTEVQDYMIQQVNRTLASADLQYVKWDMNRPLTDCFSPALCEQGRFAHAWTLGLYRVLNEIVEANPKVLFEGCAAGGNRFDLGMLSFMPQIWTSDDTDAYERMKIQTGTSYGYPQSVMGCHVSAVPNHQTTRTTPIETRFDVAAFGLLGYELDLTQVSSAERKVIAAQIAFYKTYRKLFQYGTFYRMQSPFEQQEQCAWAVVSEDKKQALVLEAMGQLQPNSETEPFRMMGLDPKQKYRITSREQMIDIRCVGSLINQVLPVKVDSAGILVHVAADHYMLPCEKEEYTAYGDLLMEAGLQQKQRFMGTGYNEHTRMMPDYSARIYVLETVD
ncbi:MAG: alpha-galactosidase [Hespellia sp.]|nr:alpha-galactosidase [Hespellia sp.]